ncbi:hypothetical protein EDD65_1254 [Keratinibaculum paraultunense]|uniref:Helix-turn-helix protein n=2 Tax=Bacteria TaxID=2 RepID=A0A3N4VCI7_9PAST|nr:MULTISPECIES: hypothetical protein [Bacteria]RPE80726.1 hypothetical protein EDC46_1713 [Vespertiliibacter pulmonis]TCS85265.1 hypothetical protein EDD65_1254 [Keratinibaculum paraultunense]
MKDYKFCALPNKWIREKKLCDIYAAKSGESIAALKCLLALNLYMDFSAKETSDVSYSKLEDLTGLSRPMVAKGINTLISKGVVKIEKESSGRKARSYKFVIGDDIWSKVPKNKMYSFIKTLNNRGISSLSALKIYLVILTFKDKKSGIANIGYEKIREYTGLQSKDIKSGLQILYEYKLIYVTQERDDSTRRYKHNSYTILF